MTNPSIQRNWTEFSEGFLPKNCSEEQANDIHIAYFAGAHSIVLALLGIQTEQQLETVLETFRKELIEWQQTMER